MIWVWLYLASILPAMLIAGYVLGRMGMGRLAVQGAVVVGSMWPVVGPIFGIGFLIEKAVSLGAKQA